MIQKLFFNLDIMAVLFDLFQQGGGSIDENTNIYKQVLQANNKGNQLPSHSFQSIKSKNNNVFQNLVVNDDTFSLIDNAFEFSQKSLMELKQIKQKYLKTQQMQLFFH